MSSATDFETYARDCVKLAEQAHTPPELREQLLQMAREWMQAMMEAEDGTCRSIEPAGRPARLLDHLAIRERRARGKRTKRTYRGNRNRQNHISSVRLLNSSNLNLLSTVRMDFSRPTYRVNQNAVCSPALNAQKCNKTRSAARRVNARHLLHSTCATSANVLIDEAHLSCPQVGIQETRCFESQASSWQK
jgi:hypothetical protein